MEKLYDINGYEGRYAITKTGKVWSYPKVKWHGGIEHDGKWINATYDQSGYLKLNLWKDAKRHRHYIHRLLLETFVPNPENKKTGNHKNGIKNDNNLENLEWATYQENNRHAHSTGLCKRRKLNNKQVKEIRENKDNLMGIVLAERYNVSSSIIYNALNRKTYNYV